jgi:hypothetical protein
MHQLFNFLLKLVKSVHLVIQTFPSISDFHKTNTLLVVIDHVIVFVIFWTQSEQGNTVNKCMKIKLNLSSYRAIYFKFNTDIFYWSVCTKMQASRSRVSGHVHVHVYVC